MREYRFWLPASLGVGLVSGKWLLSNPLGGHRKRGGNFPRVFGVPHRRPIVHLVPFLSPRSAASSGWIKTIFGPRNPAIAVIQSVDEGCTGRDF